MGQFQSDAAAALVEEALASLEIDAGEDPVASLARYVEELARWGRRINLTGDPSTEAITAGPLFDALTLIPVLRDEGTLVDVGSGGGLPGIPAAILRPGVRATLIEPRGKRTAFLRHAVHTLGLSARVVESRLEQLDSPPFDGAVAQAVWPPAEWIERALTRVRPGGAIYVLASSELGEKELPGGVVIEKMARFTRPKDGALRCSVRLGRQV